MQEIQEMWVWPLGQEDPLEEELETHSNILAWKIPCVAEPGRLQSMGLQRVRHAQMLDFAFDSRTCHFVFYLFEYTFSRLSETCTVKRELHLFIFLMSRMILNT